MGQRGHPRRDVTFMYAAWTLATLAIAGYGLATSSWQLMIACLALQRTRDGRDDRLGDDQAAARAGVDARPGFQPRLDDLDRIPSALLRAHGSGRRRGRSEGRRSSARQRSEACSHSAHSSCQECGTSRATRRPTRCRLPGHPSCSGRPHSSTFERRRMPA